MYSYVYFSRSGKDREREKIETERDSGRGFDRRGIKEDQIRD